MHRRAASGSVSILRRVVAGRPFDRSGRSRLEEVSTVRVEGDIYTSRMAMAAGADFRGPIDIPQSQSGRAAAASTAQLHGRG